MLLCSSSATRAKILDSCQIEYEQKPVSFDEETITTKDPKAFVYQAAYGKFCSAKERYCIDKEILTADTVIECAGKLLRKPKDEDDAQKMLKMQSGASVKIMSALFFQNSALFFSDISVTQYKLSPFEKNDLQEYISSGLWQGKAGGIMVEGFCKKYIISVTGLQSTAMGLQIEKLLPFIK